MFSFLRDKANAGESQTRVMSWANRAACSGCGKEVDGSHGGPARTGLDGIRDRGVKRQLMSASIGCIRAWKRLLIVTP